MHGRMNHCIDFDGILKKVAKQHRLYGEVANQDRGNSQQDQRHGHHPRRLMGIVVVTMTMVSLGVLIKPLFTMEDQEIHAERIKSRDKYARHHREISPS